MSDYAVNNNRGESSPRINRNNNTYLVLRSASAGLYVVDAETGQRDFVSSGDTLPINGFEQFCLYNPTGFDVVAQYQLTDKKIAVAPSSTVKIDERVDVDRILNTVDCQIRNNRNMQSLDDVVVGAQQTVQICRGSSVRKELIVQNVSPTFAAVRVGCSGVGSNRGLILGGSIAAPQTATLTTGGAVFVYNSADCQAVLAVMEVRQ